MMSVFFDSKKKKKHQKDARTNVDSLSTTMMMFV